MNDLDVLLPDGTRTTIAAWLGCVEHRLVPMTREELAIELELGPPSTKFTASNGRRCPSCRTIVYVATFADQAPFETFKLGTGR